MTLLNDQQRSFAQKKAPSRHGTSRSANGTELLAKVDHFDFGAVVNLPRGRDAGKMGIQLSLGRQREIAKLEHLAMLLMGVPVGPLALRRAVAHALASAALPQI